MMRVIYTIPIIFLLTLLFCNNTYGQPNISPAPGYQWVKVSNGAYSIVDQATFPTADNDTSYGIADRDPLNCTTFCSGSCDGESYIQHSNGDASPYAANSCESRLAFANHWNNQFPESNISNGASSGTVYLPRSARIDIKSNTAPGNSSTYVGGDENRLWVSGGTAGESSAFKVEVDYIITWVAEDLSVAGSSIPLSQSSILSLENATPSSEYETAGWNNGTTEGFGQHYSESAEVPISNIVQDGSLLEVVFTAEANIDVQRIQGNADARAQHGPAMQGLFFYIVQYDIWEIRESVVPVELVSFTATEDVNDDVLLEWSTATEINSERFVIEKQIGQEWMYLDEQRAAGNSTTAQKYYFVDKDQSGTQYYRLKMIDLDGSIEYSQRVSITFRPEKNEYQAYPNPFFDELNFSIQDNNYVTEIYDLAGRMVLNAQIKGTAISTASIKSGMYILVIKNANGEHVHQQKLTKL